MASTTLELEQTLDTAEWLGQAEKVLARLSTERPFINSDEFQKELEYLTLLGMKLPERSLPVCFLELTILVLLGVICIGRGDWSGAMRHSRQAEYLADGLTKVIKVSNRSEFSSWKERIEQLRQDVLPYIESYSALQHGEFLVERGDWLKGLSKLYEALKIFQLIDNTDGKATASMGIGNVHHKLGDYEIAQSYYWDAIRFFRKSNNKLSEGQAQLQYGSVLIDQQDYAAAFSNILSACNTIAEVEDVEKMGLLDEWKELSTQLNKLSTQLNQHTIE